MKFESSTEKSHLLRLKPEGRRSIRLPRYDYTQPGAFFVTICTLNQLPILGRILNGEIILSQEGNIVMKCLERIPHHFKNSTLDIYTIMSNHIHAIIVLTQNRRGEASVKGTGIFPLDSELDASPLHLNDSRPRGAKKGSLEVIVQNFKSVSTRKINQLRETPGDRIWQRNHFEHIIRTERALKAIRQYILSNPVRWEMDLYNHNGSGIDEQARAFWEMLREKKISKELERIV